MQTKHNTPPGANYSHGLEKIYAFETVNPQTVRTFNVAVAPSTPTPEQLQLPLKKAPDDKQKQLHFSFVTKLPQLRLKEPIEVLHLTPFAQKGLLSIEKKTVEEALELINSTDRSHKGLGKGHIEEIQTKIAAYLEVPTDSPSVDFKALCRILCSHLEPKERYVILASCNLQFLTTLTPTETNEFERWTRKERLRCLASAVETCREKHAEFLRAILKQISEAYLVSWVRDRLSFSTASELRECLQGLSNEPELARGTILLLDLLCNPQSLFDDMLYPIEPNIYAANQKAKEDFARVCNLATTYFYQPFITYPLETLSQFIRRDFVKQWIGLEEGFIEKVLTTSSRFTYNGRQICLGIMPL